MTDALDVIVERTVAVRGELPHVAPPVLWVWADAPQRFMIGHPVGSWARAVQTLALALGQIPDGIATTAEGYALLNVTEDEATARGYQPGDICRLSVYDERIRSVLEVKAWTPTAGHCTVIVPITIDDAGLGQPDPPDRWTRTDAVPLSARTPGDPWFEAIATLAALSVPDTPL